jgi:hypothetical protein
MSLSIKDNNDRIVGKMEIFIVYCTRTVVVVGVVVDVCSKHIEKRAFFRKINLFSGLFYVVYALFEMKLENFWILESDWCWYWWPYDLAMGAGVGDE